MIQPSIPFSEDLRALPALSIRPLWAHAIVHLGKDIENRSWGTKYRGRFLIHAGLGDVRKDRRDFLRLACVSIKAAEDWWNRSVGPSGGFGDAKCGGIIGVAEIIDCVHDPENGSVVAAKASPWWIGPYGFILRNVRPVDFKPCRGALSFFKPQIGE